MRTYNIKGVFRNIKTKQTIAKNISNQGAADAIALRAVSNGWWDVDVEEVNDGPEQSSESPV